MKEKLLVAIDIETSGCRVTKNGILAIGYCIGTIDGKYKYKKRINIKLSLTMQFEKRCYDEFWSKNKHLLKEFEKSAYEPQDGIQKFIDHIDALEDEYELLFISDNSAFDFAFINYYLDVYLDRRTLSYIKGGKDYRPLFDTDCYTRGVLGMDYSNPWTSDQDVMNKLNIKLPESVVHDHLPENDAEHIYELHRMIIKKLNFE